MSVQEKSQTVSKEIDGLDWEVWHNGEVSAWELDKDTYPFVPGQIYWSGGNTSSPGDVIWELVRLGHPIEVIRWVSEALWTRNGG